MIVMPVPEIINEIDAYLSCSRQARELLLDGRTKAPQMRAHPRKRKILVRQAKLAIVGKRRDNENESESHCPVAHLKKVTKRVDSSASVTSVAVEHSKHSEQRSIMTPQRTIPASVLIQRLQARRRTSTIRSVHHRTATGASGNKPDVIKPAIALAGPMNTKIVVVSAEQVQQERERAAHPEVRTRRLAASGLSGRRAFEALFKDETDPLKSS